MFRIRNIHLPRPLTTEQDLLIQQELCRRNDRNSNALLLMRHTGMRIGELVDLSLDCLRPLGTGQWAIHVPLGKLKTERWVPVDSVVCGLVDRLRSLRSPGPAAGRLLLSRPRGRTVLVRKIRSTFRDAVAAVGINTRLVPHQLRHTYGTEMLRAGVSFAAVIKLLGHKSPHMTLEYLEITQQDLQREFALARSHPRHLAPHPRTPHTVLSPHADLATLIDSLHAAQHVLEMYRRGLADPSARRSLDRLANRLAKLLATTKNLD